MTLRKTVSEKSQDRTILRVTAIQYQIAAMEGDLRNMKRELRKLKVARTREIQCAEGNGP